LELRRRLIYVALSVAVFSTAAYGVQQQIVGFLLRPSRGQDLIYTTPGGGLDFLIKVCMYTGIVCSLPVIVYQILKYIEPLIGDNEVRFALKGSIISACLAMCGMAFGYFAGLPATMHFLFNQFTTDQIHPLITIQSYMSFVTIYMFGAALLFQVPLILVCINRIKPLTPKGLFGKERWMILIAFVLAFIMNPTPNVVDQLMLAGPMILSYQIGIGLIAYVNRPKLSRRASTLLEQDKVARAEREARLRDFQTTWREAEDTAMAPLESTVRAVSSSIKTELDAIRTMSGSLSPAAQLQAVAASSSSLPENNVLHSSNTRSVDGVRRPPQRSK
jgi:sec-independent protein translocase protein TatC